MCLYGSLNRKFAKNKTSQISKTCEVLFLFLTPRLLNSFQKNNILITQIVVGQKPVNDRKDI